MAVTILDAWVVDGTYAIQDANFAVSAGTDRIVLVCLSAEKNASGPMAVSSVTLGDQTLTELFDFVAGSSTGYHNLLWAGYLLESEIAARVGDGITIVYSNAPDNPFDEPHLCYASYQGVDQTTPIADSDFNTSTSATTLQLAAAITAADDDKIIGCNVLGQPNSPGLSTAGYTEEGEFIGGANGHSIGVYHRTATTAVTENPTFTGSAATRMAVAAWVLQAAAGSAIEPAMNPLTMIGML